MPSEVVIRTMRDDLAEPVPPRPSLKVAQNPVPLTSSGTESVTPLPPKQSTRQKAGKVVVVPARRRRRRRWIVGVILLLLVLAGAAGAGWWVWQQPIALPFLSKEVVIARAEELLPATTAGIIQYRFTTAEDRGALLSVWGAASTEESFASFLRGDVRFILSDPEVHEVYYVLLEDDPRPYVLTPKTALTETSFASVPKNQVREVQGWYISHPVTPEAYITALQEGSIAAAGGEPLLTDDVTAPIRLIMGPAIIKDARASLVAPEAADGQLQKVALAARYLDTTTLALKGVGTALGSAPETTEEAEIVDQQLLLAIPARARFAHVGADFETDLADWTAVSRALDTGVLGQDAVQDLLRTLKSSYAFFAIDGSSSPDFGLVVVIPPELKETLRLGDPALEEALTALVPLLTGKKSITTPEFNEGAYQGVPLRYTNINSTAALDYAITDDYILIATSKDAMFALIDTINGSTNSVTTSGGLKSLITSWGTIPAAQAVSIGQVELPFADYLFPSSENNAPRALGLAAGLSKNGRDIPLEGLLQATPLE